VRACLAKLTNRESDIVNELVLGTSRKDIA
jgi:FixJ family two-component response regulator